MFRMLQFPEATTRDPEIDVWLTKHPDELHAIAQRWFARMRQCGSDVRELMHDGYPVACVMVSNRTMTGNDPRKTERRIRPEFRQEFRERFGTTQVRFSERVG